MKYTRICPTCGKEIQYKSLNSLSQGNIKNSKCRKCSAKLNAKHRDYLGKNNPMYGKSLYDVWLEKYGKEEADKKFKKYCNKPRPKQSKATCEKKRLAVTGKNNPMYGKSLYDVWLEKYGKEEADKLLIKFKQKISKAVSGSSNPMFGKPSPQGSGNGWSGWFKGYFFRSLLELSYLVYLIENNVNFKIIDKNSEYKVEYYKNQQSRTYFPDFYLEDTQKIIEIKPYKTVYFTDNIIKFNAAQKKYGDKFIIITDKDIKRLTNNEIIKLYNSGDLQFIDRYEQKYKELIEKKCNN